MAFPIVLQRRLARAAIAGYFELVRGKPPLCDAFVIQWQSPGGSSEMLALSSMTAVALIAGAFTMQAATKISHADFGKMADGTGVQIYTLTNAHGLEARITTYGGAVVSLKTPDRAGAMGDIVQGFDSLAGYLAPEPYFGALIGRYGNRIGHAKFKLNGKDYTLAKNDGDNTLHGGNRGFDKVVWTGRELPDGGLELTYTSKDG